MKKPVLLLVAAATLAGCVAVPYHAGPPQRPHVGPHHGDRDRDGIPNRADRDRDGDGVRNRDDRRPNDPRRY
ncbi:MAG: lipoprotein [Polaromonas sp.]|nr:lipoprotein [Polaromonas sp.]